jgi:hypothetical protein
MRPAFTLTGRKSFFAAELFTIGCGELSWALLADGRITLETVSGATKEALRAATTEQLRKHSRAGRSQTAFSAKTLRAAGLLSVAGVDSFLTARCGALRAAKAALATAKIPRRSAHRSFQTGLMGKK